LNESKATRYQRLRRRTTAAGIACAAVVLASVAFTPLSRAMADVAGWATPGPFALVVFILELLCVWELAALPAAIYFARRVRPDYLRDAVSVEEVLISQLQAAAVVLPAAVLAGVTVRASVAFAGALWLIPATCVLFAVVAGVLRFAPVIVNLVADVRPLARPELARRLDALASRARVTVSGVGEWATSGEESVTALVTGVGRHTRVLLSSEIVRHWADDEVVVVVAHELAHHVYRDIWRTVALDVGILLAALVSADAAVRYAGPFIGVAGPGDLAALPLMACAVLVIWLSSAPLRFAQSRRQERRADVFALAMTDGAEAFGSAIRRLGARHLAEERPSALTRWLSYRHPSVAERLALAEAYRRIKPAR